MRTVIIGGGSLDSEVAIRTIGTRDDCYIIAADRGVDYCRLLDVRPDVIIGDFDSVSEGTKMILPEYEKEGITVIRLNPIKDDTDLEAALDLAMKQQADGDIYILAATGTRIDHVLGNLSLLKRARVRGRTAILVDRMNRIRMISSGESVRISKSEQYGKYVSLVPLFGPCEGVSASGVFYPLDNATVGKGEYYYTLTISNEITADEAQISVGHGDLLVIESKD